MRHRATVTGTMILLTMLVAGGCGGGKSGNGGESPTRSAFVLQELADNVRELEINGSGDLLATRQFRVEPGVDHRRVFLWKNGVWQNLGEPVDKAFGDHSFPVDINNQGQVVFKTAQAGGPPVEKMLLYNNGVTAEIRATEPNIQNLIPRGIADDGTIVGMCAVRIGDDPSQPGPIEWRNFRLRNGNFTLTEGIALWETNAAGEGLVELTPTSPEQRNWGLQYSDGRTVALNDITPEATNFSPAFLGDGGAVVGTLYVEAEARNYHAVLRNGTLERIMPDTDESFVEGINRHGDIVGKNADGPFLRRRNGEMVNLSEYFSEADRKAGVTAAAIDDKGSIIAQAGLRLYLLTLRNPAS